MPPRQHSLQDKGVEETDLGGTPDPAPEIGPLILCTHRESSPILFPWTRGRTGCRSRILPAGLSQTVRLWPLGLSTLAYTEHGVHPLGHVGSEGAHRTQAPGPHQACPTWVYVENQEKIPTLRKLSCHFHKVDLQWFLYCQAKNIYI